MPMPLAAQQIPIGDHLYLFKSASPTTSCLIFGHAGLATRLNLPMFPVPEGVTLHFYVHHGEAHLTTPTRPLDWKGKPSLDIRQREYCHNYIVVKGVGSHWHKDTKTYLDIRRIMDDPQLGLAGWRPHYVTVRNREGFFRGKGYCSLQEILTSVLAFSKQAASGLQPITDFYFGGCRGIESDWTP